MTDQALPMEPVDDGEGPFIDRVLRALDGQLGADELAELKAQLAGDSDKRRLFVQLCLQASALTEALNLHRQGEAVDDHDLIDALEVRRAADPAGDHLVRRLWRQVRR